MLTHLSLLLLINARTNFPTVTSQNGENQVTGLLGKKLTIVFKPTFVVLTLRKHTPVTICVGKLLLCLRAS